MTQRGNRSEDNFFTDEDREANLLWLRERSDKAGFSSAGEDGVMPVEVSPTRLAKKSRKSKTKW